MYKYIKTFTIVAFILALILPAVHAPAMAFGQAGAATGGAELNSATADATSNSTLLGRSATLGKRWKGGTTYDLESGKYKAVVTDRKTGDSYTWGEYDSQSEAQSEANGQANYNNRNGVVDAPGCNTPPFWMEC